MHRSRRQSPASAGTSDTVQPREDRVGCPACGSLAIRRLEGGQRACKTCDARWTPAIFTKETDPLQQPARDFIERPLEDPIQHQTPERVERR